MNPAFFAIVSVYIAVLSLITAVCVIYDKSAARRHKRRISENALMLLGFFGAAVTEYIVMKIIHHKTLHKKFMIGLPLFAIVHIALLCILYFKPF